MPEKENGKPVKDRLLKSVLTTILGFTSTHVDHAEDMLNQELFAALLDRLHKSKDDLVGILGREIGQSIAAALKGPVDELLAGRQVEITITLKPASPAQSPASPVETAAPKAIAKHRRTKHSNQQGGS